jgi:hypothetical protein
MRSPLSWPRNVDVQRFASPASYKVMQFALSLLKSGPREHIMNITIMEAVMLDVAGQGSIRDEQGRFVPGQSGNPAGKAPGTRNRATLLREALDGEDGPAMARMVIDKALAGDVVAAKFCIGRLMPKPRDRGIEIDLPEGARARDIVAAYDATVRAMMSGEITPDEAVQVTRVLDGRLRAIEAAAREAEREARGARRAAAKPSPPEKFTSKPSPSGRGLGEGVGPRSTDADRVAAKCPHSGPLPRGEGGMSMGEAEPNAGSLLPPRLRTPSRFPAALLHSTCISRSPPLSPALAAGGAMV